MNKIIVIAGVSGVGKDTILNKLNIKLCRPEVSWTTRPIRDNEVQGRDYSFVKNNSFLEMIRTGTIIEHRVYNVGTEEEPINWYYGTHILSMNRSYNVALVLDIDGMEELIKQYPGRVIPIVVTCPDNIRYNRARARSNFTQEEWTRRLEDDNRKYNESTLSGKGYHFVPNIDITEAIIDIEDIIAKELISN